MHQKKPQGVAVGDEDEGAVVVFFHSEPLDKGDGSFLNLKGRLDGVALVSGVFDVFLEVGIAAELGDELTLPPSEPDFIESRAR